MESETVWGAMEKAFLETKNFPLAERLVAALEAAQAEGGDIRGKQSAAILVVRGESTGKIWEDRLVDLRNIENAVKEYGAAEKMFPDNLEMKFWHAVTLANAGEMDVALPLFREVFTKNKKWHTLTPRLIKPKLLIVSESDLKTIINLIQN